MKVNKLVSYIVLALVIVGSIAVSRTPAAPKGDTVVLSKDNTVIFRGVVEGNTVGKAIQETRALDNKRSSEPIYLFMDTPGGEIQSGMEFLEALHGLNRRVDTVTLFSASMGFQMVQGLGERLILKNGVLMSHRAAGQITGSFGGTRPSQMDARYNLWLSRMQEFDEQTVSRSKGKQTLESYQKAYAEELWLTGKQAVEGGYADKTVTVKCDKSLDGVTSHSTTFFGFPITYDMDNCPINTSPLNVRVGAPQESNGDAVLTEEKKEELKNKFLENYSMKIHAVIPMHW